MERKIRIMLIGFAVIVALVTMAMPLNLEPTAQIVLAILFFTMIMWFSEVIPLHITALMAAFLLITFGGFTPKETFAPFFDPVVVLILGGFVLALGMQKHKLDETITYKIVNYVGGNPKKLLFGIMCLSAFMSMWITNTASTAVILPIAVIILAKNNLLPLNSSFGKSLVLGVAYAATIGGIGTLIGSTPNLIAAKFLGDAGSTLSFLDWMFYGMPIVVVMVPVAWFVLTRMYKPEVSELKTGFKIPPVSKEQKMVAAIFVFTIFLWLTSQFTGLGNATVALVPIILLYIFGLLGTADFSKINWSALILFGGGLTLGSAIHSSGLDAHLASFLQYLVVSQPYFLVLLIVIVFAFMLTIVASNTAAAVVMIPIVIPLGALLGIDIRILTIAAAIGVSLDFIVPVGTPPNTIAYSSGYIKAKDMALSGAVIAVIGVFVLAGFAYFTW